MTGPVRARGRAGPVAGRPGRAGATWAASAWPVDLDRGRGGPGIGPERLERQGTRSPGIAWTHRVSPDQGWPYVFTIIET